MGTGDIQQEASGRDPGKETCSGGLDGFDMSLLPLKKRALNDYSRGGGRCYDGSDNDSPPRPPKKRRVDDCIAGAAERKKNDEEAGGSGMSVAEKLRLIKGKSIAPPETNNVFASHHPPTPVTVKKQQNKLMHDGIRSGARFNQGGEKKQPELIVGGEVQRQLAELRATRPRFVHRKRLEKSDVCPNQNRLLISCKRESLALSPITACFAPAETPRVQDKNVGLHVTALDRDGARHALTCKYLESNESYRLISGWGDLLKRNGLVLDGRGGWRRDVEVELWAFRSRALPKQPKLGPDGKKVVGEEEDHLHPEGALGILVLHRENRRRAAYEDDDDPPVPVARRRGGEKKKQQRGGDKRDASVSTSAARAASVREAQREVATMPRVDMAAKFGALVSDAVVGMMGLRDAIFRERQHQNVVVGCAT